MKIICILLFAALSLASSFKKDGNTLIFEDETWMAALKEKLPMIVEFYAPWCTHCQKLAPEWAKLADALKGSGVTVGKVNAAENALIANKHKITSYPTIKFLNSTDEVTYSGGPLTAEALVRWTKIRMGTLVTICHSVADVAALNKENDVFVLGAFTSLTTEVAKEFMKLAGKFPDSSVVFAVTASPDVLELTAVPADSVTVIRSSSKAKVASLTLQSGFLSGIVESYITVEVTPTVLAYIPEANKQILAHPVKQQALLFTDSHDPERHDTPLATLTSIAESLKGKLLAVNVPLEASSVLSHFNVLPSSLPALILVDGATMKTVRFSSSSWEKAEVAKFISLYFSGEISGELPWANDVDPYLTLPNAVALTDQNSEQVLRNISTPVLVAIYTPRCVPCSLLAEKLAVIAPALASSGIGIITVNALDAKNYCKSANVRKFPSIGVREIFGSMKLFKPSEVFPDGAASLKANDITLWARRQSGLAVVDVASLQQIEHFRVDYEQVMVGVFPEQDPNSKSLETAFRAVAAADSGALFPYAVMKSSALASELGIQSSTIMALRSFDEPRLDFVLESQSTAEDMKAHVMQGGTRLVTNLDESFARKNILALDVDTHVIMFSDPTAEYHNETLTAVTAAAKMLRGQAVFISALYSEQDHRIFSHFKLDANSLPALFVFDKKAIVDDPESQLEFPLFDPLTVESVSKHVSGFLSGTLRPPLKSEAISADDNTGDVVIAKGKTFRDVIINNDKDVFIEFYAPWCGHCKKLAPTWEKLGKALKGSDVIVAKMDATANEIDVKGLEAKGYPSLFWIPGNKKTKPVPYLGSRRLEELLEYVKEHATGSVGGGGGGGPVREEL